MQITSTVAQTKMEKNGNLNEPISDEAADQVGGAFCQQFYVTVSENRANLTKFYGHDSIFQLDDQGVTGPTEIAMQYSKLPESTHFKIHSIKGLPTFHKQGVLINVIGTVNLRPFVQTFVLGQQGQKKYYVEIDSFQYLDNYFENKREVVPKPTTSNGHSNGVKGKATKPAAKVEEPQKQTPQKAQTPKKAEEPRPAKQETPKSAEKENKAPNHHPNQQQPPQQHQTPAPVQVQEQAPVPIQEPPKPKTWATLVRQGGNQQQPPQPQQPNYGQLHQQQLHQQHMQAAAALHQHQQAQAQAQAAIYQQAQRAQQQAQQAHAAQQQHPSSDLHQSHGEDNASLLERKIYLGGITREIVPSNTAQAETEIKQVFYKYGEVEEVRMPRKVLDSPNDTSKHAFAFITMRSKQGVQAIFADANRDEQGNWKLPLKLDAFGFDGLAQISEQRDQPGGGFRGGRGGGFGNRGGFFRRGGPGGGPRGGMRGGFQNNGLNGGH